MGKAKSTFSSTSAPFKTPTTARSEPASSRENLLLISFKRFLAVYSWTWRLNTATVSTLILNAQRKLVPGLVRNRAVDSTHTGAHLKLTTETGLVAKQGLMMLMFCPVATMARRDFL